MAKLTLWLCREHGFVNESQSLLKEGWPKCPECGDICDKVVGDSILTYATSTVGYLQCLRTRGIAIFLF